MLSRIASYRMIENRLDIVRGGDLRSSQFTDSAFDFVKPLEQQRSEVPEAIQNMHFCGRWRNLLERLLKPVSVEPSGVGGFG